jgi:malate synthase
VAAAPGAPEGPPPPLLAAVSMWINDFKKFADGANAHAKEVAQSMAAITSSAPMAQFDSIVADFGAERGTVLSETRCLTYLIEAKEGAKWDSNNCAKNYLPRFFAAYGPEAIRRIEVTEGIQSANGSKALMLGSVNFYIADVDKFVEVTSSDAVKQVVAEESKFFQTPPIQTLMQVFAVG